MEILEKIVNTSKCFVKRRSCPVFGHVKSVHVGRVLMTLENKFPMTTKSKNKLIMIRRHVPRIVIRRDIVANPWRGVKSNDFYDRFIAAMCCAWGRIRSLLSRSHTFRRCWSARRWKYCAKKSKLLIMVSCMLLWVRKMEVWYSKKFFFGSYGGVFSWTWRVVISRQMKLWLQVVIQISEHTAKTNWKTVEVQINIFENCEIEEKWPAGPSFTRLR